MKTIIIGAGISGLSTGFYLKNNYLILEKEKTPGGLCRSVNIDGFTFDYTGHFLHLHTDFARELIFNLLKPNIKKIKRNSWIYSHGVYTRYPFQANLQGLPEKIINECIEGLIETKLSTSNYQLATSNSFYDWCIATFGKGITRYFMFPYNKKLWTVPLRNLTTEWVKPFIPEPKLKEVILGAVTDRRKLYGYNTYFYYPKKDGIQKLIDVFAKKNHNLLLNSTVEYINYKKKYVVSCGQKINYKYLVSTIPLPELLKITCNLPKEIHKAKNQLLWNSVLCINLGVNRPNICENKHWIYFPENDFAFYRVGFYHNFSKISVPKNHSSMYIEIAHKYKQNINPKDILPKILVQLQKCKILKKTDHISTVNILPIPYAYVIYDKNRNSILEKIFTFLETNNVYSIGRFGAWKYSYIEESILDGKSTAEKINNE